MKISTKASPKFIIRLLKRVKIRTWVALIIILIFLPPLYFLLRKPPPTEAAWYNYEWQNRKLITINSDQVSGSNDLSNFPVLVSIDSDNDLAASTQDDGSDILFTDTSGNKLSHEIEKFDHTTGQLIAWVKIPTLSASSNTEFYLYYNNLNATDQQDIENVWDSNFAMVQHLNETSGTHYDSTSNNNDSTTVSVTSQGTGTGQIDGADVFTPNQLVEGTSSNFDSFLNTSSSTFTISAWINHDIQSWDTILSTQAFRFQVDGSGDRLTLGVTNGTNTWLTYSTGTIGLGELKHIAVTKNGTNITYYANGAEIGTATIGDYYQAVTSFRIGSDGLSGIGSLDAWDGTIDELQFSSSVRTQDWLATQYNNQNNPSSFISLDSQESFPNLVAYYKFDEGVDNTCSGGTNDVCDSSGQGHDGAITGATWNTTDQCLSGTCLYFDGTNDYVDTNYDYSLSYTGGTTFSLWFKPTTIDTGGQVKNLISKNAYEYMVAQLNDGLRIIQWNPAGGNAIYHTITSALSANQWYHLVLVYDGSQEKSFVYLNGTLIDSQDNLLTSFINRTETTKIGAGYGWGGSSTPYFNGFIDEFKIYPYARSADQVKTDYNQFAQVLGVKDSASLNQGLVAYWKLDESSDTTATDSSGNGHNATLSDAQESGTSDASGNTTTTLVDTDSTSLSSTDDSYNGMILYFTATCGSITSGTQSKISDYTGSTQSFVLESTLAQAPDSCAYEIRHQTAAKFSNGISIDGYNDHLIAPYSSDFDFERTDPFSISFWIKPKAASIYPDLMGHGAGTGYYFYKVDNNLRFYLRSVYGTSMIAIQASSALQNDVWKHVVATYDGSSKASGVKLYIDGQLYSTTTLTDNLTSTLKNNTGFNIAHTGASGANWFTGSFDEVRIYKRELSAQEANSLYNLSSGPYLYLNFDEGTGSTVNDKSGNAYSGTWNGSGTHWTQGKFGNAALFDGSTDYISFASLPKPSNTSFTMMFWAKPNSATPVGIFDSAPNQQNVFRNYSSGYIEWWNSNPRFSLGLTANTWQHVAIIVDYDGTNRILKYYKNGVYQTTVTSATIPTLAWTTFRLGNINSGTAGWYSGALDEFKIYNYARTPQQIIEDMNASHPTGGSPITSKQLELKLDENQGTTAHDTGLIGDDGVLTDGPTWTSSGKFNSAITLDGLNDRIQNFVSGPFEYTGGDMSFSFWFKPNASDTDQGWIISKPWNGSGQYNYYLYLQANNTIQFRLHNGDTHSNQVIATSTQALTDGQWQHIAVTVNGSSKTAKIYINGALNVSGTHSITNWTPSSSDGNISLVIGSLYPYSSGWAGNTTYSVQGEMDEIKFYNSTLTADQVKLDYNQGASVNYGGGVKESSLLSDGTGNDPKIEWKFDDNSGTNALDTSGNNNTGQLTSGPTWTQGKYGSAVNFNTNNSSYVISTSDPGTMSQGTYSLWIKPSTTNATMGWIDSNFDIFQWTGNLLYFRAGNQSSISISSLDTNKWHHAALTWDGSNYYGYLDGRLVTSGVQSANRTGQINIGRVDNNYYLTGSIDQVQVYDYARTPSQIAYDYNRGAPAVHYKFDECQGTTANDSSGNNNSGTITPASLGNTSAGTCNSGDTNQMWNDGTTGKFNSALGFDGSDDSVSVASSTSIDLTSGLLSLSAWVYWDGSSGSNYILDKSNNKYNLSLSAGLGRPTFYINGGTIISASSAISANQWHHLVGTYDGTTERLYVDGLLVDSVVDNVSITSGGSLVIGCYSTCSSTYSFHGLIDDVRIYNYPLSISQIKQVYNGGFATFYGPETGSP